MYTSSRQMLSLISGRHAGTPGRAPTWALHTELYKFAWNVSANNSRAVSHTDLRLGEVGWTDEWLSG